MNRSRRFSPIYEGDVNLWSELAKLESSGSPAALVTVIRVQGSTPREAGARMIVLPDGKIIGTIGGSAVESLVVQEALEVLRIGKSRVSQYDLNDPAKTSTGMICGGKMEFFIEPLKPLPHLYIFGAGHVGSALAQFTSILGLPHTVVDDRPEFADRERFPQAQRILCGDFSEVLADLDFVQPAYIMIVTRCHDTDLEVLRWVLRKPSAYLGMICSRRKKTEIFRILSEEGYSKEEMERVHAPIGLDIRSETPAEIAVSILAEVIQIKNCGKR